MMKTYDWQFILDKRECLFGSVGVSLDTRFFWNKYFWLYKSATAWHNILITLCRHLCSWWRFCVRLICLQINKSVTALGKFTDCHSSTLFNELGDSLQLFRGNVNKLSTIICYTWNMGVAVSAYYYTYTKNWALSCWHGVRSKVNSKVERETSQKII